PAGLNDHASACVIGHAHADPTVAFLNAGRVHSLRRYPFGICGPDGDFRPAAGGGDYVDIAGGHRNLGRDRSDGGRGVALDCHGFPPLMGSPPSVATPPPPDTRTGGRWREGCHGVSRTEP